MAFPFVIKICKALKGTYGSQQYINLRQLTGAIANQSLSKLAWRFAIDRCGQFHASLKQFINFINSHRTLVPLQFPPHIVALGSIYVAALVSSFEQSAVPSIPGSVNGHEMVALLSQSGPWETKFQAQVSDLEGQ